MEPLYNDVLGIANDILHPVLLKCMEQNLLITNQFPKSLLASLNRGSTVYVAKGELLLKPATHLAILYADRRDRRKSPGVPGAAIAIFAVRRDRRIKSPISGMSDIGD